MATIVFEQPAAMNALYDFAPTFTRYNHTSYFPYLSVNQGDYSALFYGRFNYSSRLMTVNSGTVTDYKVSIGGKLSYRVENLDLNYFDVEYSYNAGDELRLLKATLSGDDQVIGTSESDWLIGFDGNDTLTGNDGADTLDGGSGNDTLIGGLGNDTYIVDSSSDVLNETSTLGSEIDSVNASFSYSLAAIANIENLTLLGTTAINGTGNALDNTLTGNSADNVLDGGVGNDTLDGGAGEDTAIINSTSSNARVRLVDNKLFVTSSAGVDVLINMEKIRFIDVTKSVSQYQEVEDNIIQGDSQNNLLVGGDGNDTFNGEGGDDTMVGGLGDDTYKVDSARDVVTETSTLAVEIDTVISIVSYTLGANIEKLTLTGTANINGMGNMLNNTMIGNSADNRLYGDLGNDTLEGGAGADTISGGGGADAMVGGDGNDVYRVNNIGDTINETNADASAGGIDDVVSSVSFTLSNNLENLRLTGKAAINGTGNSLDNLIIGNFKNNILTGGAGKDTLTGGKGADSFVFNALDESLVGASRDVITDFNANDNDVIDLSGLDADSSSTGNQAFSSTILTGGLFTQIGQLRFEAGVLYGNTDTNFATAEFEIALTGVTTLSASALLL